MFIVLLKFSDNKAAAPNHMDAHKAWIEQGFADGVFALLGNLQPGLGGGIVAHNTTRDALLQRVEADPFIAENIVSAEILEIDPSRADDRLAFLLS